MGYLIGTDEAGYGPNYGPLVITATCWHVPGDPWDLDLYRLLRGAVEPRVSLGMDSAGRFAIADSKVLYKSGGNLGRLELGVLATAAQIHGPIDRWRRLWTALCPGALEEMETLPWYAGVDVPLPVCVEPSRVARSSDRLSTGCLESGAGLESIRARAIFAPRFNELLGEHDSKASALSRLTIDLVAEILNELKREPVLVICDKHGGRNRYQRLLQERFTDDLVEVRCEGRSRSVYAWGASPRRVEIRFCVGAEKFFQVALASMTSKYLRELAMQAFNRYWCDQVPRLRPTAGYPQDARRFKSQIRSVQTSLGIADRSLWRAK